jgi:hypothetical protein
VSLSSQVGLPDVTLIQGFTADAADMITRGSKNRRLHDNTCAKQSRLPSSSPSSPRSNPCQSIGCQHGLASARSAQVSKTQSPLSTPPPPTPPPPTSTHFPLPLSTTTPPPSPHPARDRQQLVAAKGTHWLFFITRT